MIPHENFDIFTFNNDIAILEMDHPLKFGPYIQPACLPDRNLDDLAGSLTVVAGWGRTDEKLPPSDVLRSVVVPIWSQDQCLNAGYGKKRITDNMMCAGYHDGKKDACQVSQYYCDVRYTNHKSFNLKKQTIFRTMTNFILFFFFLVR